MAKQRFCLFVLLLAFFVGAPKDIAQEKGTIRGTVVDEHLVPVSNVKVNADHADNRKKGSLIRYVETDSDGRFVIDRLDWGTYRIFTVKEDAAYPNTRASFYSNDIFPVANISPSVPEAYVTIQLGPKGGVLTGSVANAVTGAPVYASFKLTRSASPNKWISTGAAASYRVLLPSSTDVLLEVSAPGFKTWRFPSALSLQPGAEMRLDIPLEPAHDPSLHASKFLVPDGYVGWVRLEYNVKDTQPVPIEDGEQVFRFPETGVLYTSSPGPERGAEDQYFYYSQDGSRNPIPQDYRGGKGMVWGQYEGSRGGVMTMFGFFVGTEEQYTKYQSQSGHPGPIPAQPGETRNPH